MARFIRLYRNESPTAERPGDILGFSNTIEGAAHDPTLHRWLTDQGYTVTPESESQRNAKMRLGAAVIRTEEYEAAIGIPLPVRTVSAGHLLIEPPVRDEDLPSLTRVLQGLTAVADGGLRRHFFLDNRQEQPTEAHTFKPEDVIAWWG